MYSHAPMARSRTGIVFILALVAGLLAPLGAPLGGPAGATPDFAFERIAGKDRFDTARVISGQQGRSNTVVLARGDVFADALSGTYLAGINDAPILLTRSDGLPAETDQAINDAGATRVIILGGVNAVTPAVEAHLRAKGLAVERVGGVDRYETSALAARHGGPAVLGTSDGLRTAIVASGANFPDALSGGPVSYAKKFPTLLTTPGAASPALLAAIDALGIRQVIIIGGPTAVAAGVESTLRGRGLNVNRLFGQDRSGTSVAVARIAVERFGFRPTHLNVARGDDFADALSFTTHAGRDSRAGGPTALHLTISSVVAGRELVDAVRSQSAALLHGHIVGGLMAISQEVEDELTRAARAGTAAIDLDFSTVVRGGRVRGEIAGANIGAVSVSGCGLRGLAVREGAGAFEFALPADQDPGTCTLVFTTNFTNGPTETTRKTITVTAPQGTGTSPTTQPESTTPTTQAGSTTSTTTDPGTTTTQPTTASTTQPPANPTTTTTQAPATTTTTQPPTTTTTVPAGTPTLLSVVAQDEAPTGSASSGDVHEFTFSKPMAASVAATGSRYSLSSAGGSANVTCGTGGVVCSLLPAGTYGGVAREASQVMRAYLGGSLPFSYPATVTAISSEWVDGSGAALSLAGSADTQLEAGRITGRPTMLSAVASASRDTVTLKYPEPVDCNGVGAAQFAYLHAENPIPQGAHAISCDRSDTIVLNFNDGFISTTNTDARIRYRESANAADRVKDLLGQPVTTGDFQQTSVQA